jgi:membrane associated rhomboid family serine protease
LLLLPLHRALTRENFPWMTLALVLANAFVFFVLESGDSARLDRAFAFYSSRGLGAIELPAYRAWVLRERADADRLLDADEGADDVVTPRVLARIEADAPFLADLHADRVITPEADGYDGWRSARAEFDALWNESIVERWELRFSEIDPKRIVGAMFLHAGLGHLAGNVLFLAVLGLLVEGALGPVAFLASYLAGGVGSALASLAWHAGEAGSALGASGAIASLMGAYCVLWGTRKVRFFWWFFVAFDYVKAPALVLLPLWLGWELVNLVWNRNAHIGFDAHAGGIVAGALLALGTRALGWERHEFLDEDDAADEAAQARIALARADAHIGRLEIASARALLDPLAEKSPGDIAIAAALYRCARYEPGMPRIESAARAVLPSPASAVGDVRIQKDVYDDYMRARGVRAIVPASLAIPLAARWPAIGAGSDAASLLSRTIARAPSTQGLDAACLAMARALAARGERRAATALLEDVMSAWPGSDSAAKARILLADLG